MSQLEILVLGELQVRRDGRLLPAASWHSRQERRLLGMLVAARGATLAAARLVELLWPGADSVAAGVTLRSAISNLRRLLEPEAVRASMRYIVTRPGGYAWNRAADAWIDSDEFLTYVQAAFERSGEIRVGSEFNPRTPPSGELAAIGELAGVLDQTLALYRGDLLEDEPEPQWVQGERVALRERYFQAVQLLAELRIAQGAWAAAVVTAQQGLARDHLREPLYRLLMLSQALAGDTAAALQSYERYRRTLDDTLGALPSPQTRELHTAILRGAIQVQPPTRSGDASARGQPQPEPPPMATRLPLVGRANELQAINGWVEQFLAGHGGTITIVGATGIGKTRLAEEVRRLAIQGGALAISARAEMLERALPFAALSEALRPLLRAAPIEQLTRLPAAALAQVAELLPVLRERLPNLPVLPPAPAAERYNRMLDGLEDIALALAQIQPLALICDDAQWIDEASLTAIGRLARRAVRHPILFVLVYRSEELPDNPALHTLLRSLGRDMLLRPILPMTLTAADTAQLLAALELGEPAQLEQLAMRLNHETGGNPLFITVAAQALLDERMAGGPSVPAGALGQAQLPDLAGTPRIRELVLARVARLPERGRELLEQLAVIGRPVSLDLIEQLEGPAGLDDAQILLERQLLVEESDERLRFAHDLVRSIIAAAISSPRRRQIHRHAAEAIAALHGQRPEYAAELAFHFSSAGRGMEAEALRYAVLAGDAARRAFGYRQALRHYAKALEAAERLGADAPAALLRQVFNGQLLTYEALLEWDGIRATVAAYDAWNKRWGSRQLAGVADLPAQQPLVTNRRLLLLRALMGDLAGAAEISAAAQEPPSGERLNGAHESPILEDMLRRTAQILQPAPPEARLGVSLASAMQRAYQQAAPLPGDPASELPQLLGEDEAALALFQVGWAALMQGLLDDAERCLRRGYQLANDSGQVAAAVICALQLAHLNALRGLAVEAGEWLARSLELARLAPEAGWAAIWPRIHQGFLWLLDDQIDAAESRFREMEAQLAGLPSFRAHRASLQVGLGLTALARGALDDADERLRTALAAPQALYGFIYAAAQHGAAQILVQRGDLAGARRILAETLADGARRGLLAEYVRTVIEIARVERDYGDPAPVLPLLRSAAAWAHASGLIPLAVAAEGLGAKLAPLATGVVRSA